MVYDNTKFYAAFDEWLAQNVDVGFGEHYAGELLEDFCEFCRETGMMKRSPGRVVFGQHLAEKGFERRKLRGLTYWSGLALKTPRGVMPVRYASTLEAAREEVQEQEKIRLREQARKSPEERRKMLADFRRELDEEERRLRALED